MDALEALADELGALSASLRVRARFLSSRARQKLARRADRRIIGMEAEITVTPLLRREEAGGRTVRVPFRNQGAIAEAARALIRTMTASRRIDARLPNGARTYVDMGDHPEYAAPETDNIFAAVTHHEAGFKMLGRAAEAITRAGREVKVHRNTTNGLKAWGTHENFSTRADLELPMISRKLGALMAARNVLLGGGFVPPQDSDRYLGHPFVLSAKAFFMTDIDGS